MLPFAQFDEELVLSCVEEYSHHTGQTKPFAITCLDQSTRFPTERFVFVLSQDEKPQLVLKLDCAPKATRLIKEFKLLQQLEAEFAPEGRLTVIKPLYLSPHGHFHVTAFAAGKTAKQKIYADPTPEQARQVYRRGGEWLHRLHASAPQERADIWLNWMLEEVEKHRHPGGIQPCANSLKRYISIMQKDLSRFDHRQGTTALSHGDFHGGNLILAQGCSYGLDFTETDTKLAVYDIVDFLKMDIFATAQPDHIGPDGIRTSSREMFLKTYRHPVDAELLSYCLRGRLLIEWVKISCDAYNSSAFQRKKFSALQDRLSKAFAQPLQGS
ncbi:phosphotransferase family protein [Pseudophaeobacter profundi]|uniref:phosphotransferase family protein n=1 Tax=Pseudophaeobacter profundi TaxID=3034152 RepID=UPI00242A56D6|nr:phosphotransferase [Pseudophaeobacter profundi]